MKKQVGGWGRGGCLSLLSSVPKMTKCLADLLLVAADVEGQGGDGTILCFTLCGGW